MTSTPQSYQAVNDRMMSQSDPDVACVRKGSNESSPRYQHHRAVDDHKGVITAVERQRPDQSQGTKSFWI
jgi:hypothetical protein